MLCYVLPTPSDKNPQTENNKSLIDTIIAILVTFDDII